MAQEERVDKWLWAMRVFKTRSMATMACKLGRVTMEGSPVKPSRMVKAGDKVSVRKSPVKYTYRVKAVSGNRLGAKLVPEYMEDITPKSQLEILEMTKISGFVDRRKGLGRPTKRDSREMERFKEEAYANSFYFDSAEDYADFPEQYDIELDPEYDCDQFGQEEEED